MNRRGRRPRAVVEGKRKEDVSPKRKTSGVGGKDDGAGAKKDRALVELTIDSETEKPSLIPVINQEQPRVTRARARQLRAIEIAPALEVQQTTTSSNLETSIGLVSTKESPSKQNELLVSNVPEGVNDFDEETINDPLEVGLYASDIFAYYKRREVRFPIKKYLEFQKELNKKMRSILVDWMVEVQESFEMNHETLYLAVKLVDMYLGKIKVNRDKLQLVGTTALYIAAKYDERTPPLVDDYSFVCADAYSPKDFIEMELTMLKAINYDLGAPLSYKFLRRYARCGELDMETLTLARFILEMSLMEYDFINVRDSMMAAAALLLALKMVKKEEPWTTTLQFHSTYSIEDLFDLTHRLYDFMRQPKPHLNAIRSKYSLKIFFKVAKTPLPDELKL